MAIGIAAEKEGAATKPKAAPTAKPKTQINAEATYNAYCAACHGENGRGKVVGSNRFPAIAGLPKWYLEDQLILFKYDGRGADHRDKEGLMMHAMIRMLRKRTMVIKEGLDEFEFEHDIVKIADYVNKLTPSQTWAPAPEMDPEYIKDYNSKIEKRLEPLRKKYQEAQAENKKKLTKEIEGLELKKKAPIDIENGKEIYNTEGVMGCVRCHGKKFEGREKEDPALNLPRAPSLQFLEDWYMLSQLKKFRKGVRGAPAKTAVGGNLGREKEEFARHYEAAVGGEGFKVTIAGSPIMQAMSLTAFAAQKDQEQAMKDVVAYIYKTARELPKEKK
jgi:cytochrome c553